MYMCNVYYNFISPSGSSGRKHTFNLTTFVLTTKHGVWITAVISVNLYQYKHYIQHLSYAKGLPRGPRTLTLCLTTTVGIDMLNVPPCQCWDKCTKWPQMKLTNKRCVLLVVQSVIQAQFSVRFVLGWALSHVHWITPQMGLTLQGQSNPTHMLPVTCTFAQNLMFIHLVVWKKNAFCGRRTFVFH